MVFLVLGGFLLLETLVLKWFSGGMVLFRSDMTGRKTYQKNKFYCKSVIFLIQLIFLIIKYSYQERKV